MTVTTIKRRPKATSRVGFGIVNPFGDMWTTDIFNSEEATRNHLKRFWSVVDSSSRDLSRYRIVRATQTTKFLADLPAPNKQEGAET